MKYTPDYSSRFRILKGGKISLVVSALVMGSTITFASPTGGQVTSGSASISQSGAVTNITQSTNKATINWQDFSIAGNETVNFHMPSTNSITLNRVIGNEKSIINGALNANGQVWLLNSSGVLFGKDASINTAGILATTKTLSDADFNAGNYHFKGNSTASVVNMGEITISEGGYAALLATNVSNEGTIKAVQGTIALVGANEYTINLNGNSLVNLKIDKGVIDSLVENKAALIADGGKIIMTSKAADEILKNVVNNSGIVEAKGIDDLLGNVEIKAEGGVVKNSGTVDVSNENGKGGTAIVTGKTTTLKTGSLITADGATGGGTVYVGGSYQNTDTSVYQATNTIVQSDTTISASATDNGNGGTIAVWSDVHNPYSTTSVKGNFYANAGANGGDGGRIETSGYHLDLDGLGVIKRSAPKGKAGEWLLDPYDMEITAAASTNMSYTTGPMVITNTAASVLNRDYIQNNLADGDVTIQAWNLTITNAVHWTSNYKLTLNAQADINVNSAVYNDGGVGTLDVLAGQGGTGWVNNGGYWLQAQNINIALRNGSTQKAFSVPLKSTGIVSFTDGQNILLSYGSQQTEVTGEVNNGNYSGVVMNGTVFPNATFKANGTSAGGSLGLVIQGSASVKGITGSGLVTINSGQTLTLAASNSSFLGELSGSGVLAISGGTLNFLNNISSGYSGSIYVNSGGTLQFNTGSNTTVSNGIYVDGGTLSNYDNSHTITLSKFLGGLIGGAKITGNVNISLDADRTYAGIFAGTTAISSASGVKTITLGNTATPGAMGTLTLNSGVVLKATSANALGSSDGGTITVNSGATLSLESTSLVAHSGLNLNGSGATGYTGALTTGGSGTVSYAQYITLGSATTIGTGTSSSLTLGGTINGAYALTLNSPNTITLSGIVGGGTALTSITTNAGGTTAIGANVTTTGTQTYNDAVSGTVASTLIANNGQLNFTGGATSNNNNLILQSGGTDLVLSGNIATGTGWLTLKKASGTAGTLSSTGTLSGSGLLVQNFATANLNLSSGHNFTTIAANGIGTAFNYIDQDAVTIGTVNSVNGLTLGSATGSVATKTGDLTISQSISSSNTTASALTLNAGSDTAAGTSTGGNIIRSGTPAISVGASGTIKLYTGSIAGTTGWGTTTLTSGSGRFRYGSDESIQAYTKALATGLNLIYREQPTIAPTISSASKIYDGIVYSGTPTLTYTLANGDTFNGVDIVQGTFTLTGEGANPTTVNAGSYTIGADLAGFSNTLGYANPTTAIAGTLTINKRVLSLSGTRVYDATADVTGDVFSTISNLVGTETITVGGTGSVTNKNVAAGKVVNTSGLILTDGSNGGLANNYTLSGGIYTVDITKADISSISGITASNKEYDRLTTATLNSASASFAGKLGSDVLTVATSTGNFADKNVADGKTVNITALTLSGTDAGNYNLLDTTASTTADITAKNLILSGTTASNKVYDKTTTATISNFGTLSGIISGDAVTVDSSSASASFADWNVANGKAVTISDLAIGGADVGNYTFSLSAPVTANITKKSLGLELTGTATRVYDGTSSLGFTGYTVSPTGVISGDTVVADTGSITGFIDKNVGSNKAVSFTGFTINGADVANYELVSGSAVTNASITKATISSVSGITAATKVYDATTAATLTTTGASFNGMFGGDNLGVATATGAFENKNAGTGKTINISGITLNGTDAGNYLLADATATATANITQKALAITYTGVNKTYDALTDATVTTTDDRLGSDVFTIARTASFADKTAADAKAVSVSGVSLSGTDALNYSIVATGSTTANILKKDVTLTGLAVNDKVYDGLSAATFGNTGTLVDFISGDTVAVNTGGMSAAFGNKNVGTGKSVILSGVTLTGDDAANYNFTSPTGSTASITQKALAVTYSGVNKVYDSTTSATVTTGDDRVGGDVLTINRTATYDTKNVGTAKAVSVSGVSLSGTDALNYSVATTGTTTSDVTKADISTVSGITAQNKTYDTTNAATLVTSGATFNGMFANDVLSVATSTGVFNDKNAADGKTVSISGITLGGTDVGNYNLVSDTATTTANISKATITAIGGITADNKVYDATTAATLTTGGATFTGKLGSDDLSVTASTASFGNKNVGTAKTVTIDSITFGGVDALNYIIANNLSTLSANITPASISAITGITAQNKVYDRTTAATLGISGASFSGKIGSDVLSVATSTGTFDSDWNVADNKTVNITGLTLGGTDALNYTLATDTASTTANITKKTLVLDLQGVGSKVYDGTASINLAGVTPTLTGIIAGDTVDVATGSVSGFVDKNVGANKSVLYSGFALSNTDAGNYDIGSGTAPSTASITRLNSVTWIGGATGNWFDAANWAGGAVPDLSNVANVIIPTGVTVNFDTTGATAGVSTTAVNIDSLGSLGSMAMTNGALNVVNDLTLASLTQNGGALDIGNSATITNFVQTAGTFNATNFDVTNSFSQTGTGTLAISGDATFDVGTNNFTLSNSGNSFGSLGVSANDVAISNITGALTLANMSVAGTLGVNIAGNILQTAGTTIDVAGATTLASTTGNIALDSATNDFQSTVNASGANVALKDANGLELGDITTTGTLGVTAVDDITQKTGTALATGGNIALASTTGDITLTEAGNNFGGSFGASANTIALTNYAHPLALGNIVSQTALTIETDNQAVTQAAGSTLLLSGTSSIDAGTSTIALTNSGNSYLAITLTADGGTFAAETVSEEEARVTAAALAAQQAADAADAAAALAAQQVADAAAALAAQQAANAATALAAKQAADAATALAAKQAADAATALAAKQAADAAAIADAKTSIGTATPPVVTPPVTNIIATIANTASTNVILPIPVTAPLVQLITNNMPAQTSNLIVSNAVSNGNLGQSFSLVAGSSVSFVSTPKDGETLQAISLDEIKTMMSQNSAPSTSSSSSSSKNSDGAAPTNTHETRVAINENSIVELVNGGIKLPEGVNQEFYIVKNENNANASERKAK